MGRNGGFGAANWSPQASRIRRQTAEHPFGTSKAWMGATHFLTKTIPRVSTEMSLHVLAYNMKRRSISRQPAEEDWTKSLMKRVPACLLSVLALCCGPVLAAMTLTSTDIAPGKPIPAVHIYTRCGGHNISPELTWSGVPNSAKSLVLTMIDVDVKPSLWSHWIVVDLPTTTTLLPQGIKSLPGNAKAIVSNFGDADYAGPCPPQGTGLHHYEFTIWAMPSATVLFAPDEKVTEVIAYLSQHALDRASLTAVVQAPPN